MRIHFAVVPIAVLALGLGSFSAEAAQREERRSRSGDTQAEARSRGNLSARARGNQDRGSRGQTQSRQRANTPSQQRNDRANRSPDRSRQRVDSPNQRGNNRVDRGGRTANRAVPRDSADRSRNSRVDQRTSRDRGADRSRNSRVDQRTSRDRGRNPRVDTRRTYNRGVPQARRSNSRYYSPRLLPRWKAPRRYYGPGGHLSLYFGWGSGYRYGSLYTGRVYGYRGRVVSGYGDYRHYGDLRLKVTPRDAAVYVDGYYAGIVDDFDGFFQRLTVEVGPHVIEIDAPGLESQAFDVYVDGSRTIDLHADLFR